MIEGRAETRQENLPHAATEQLAHRRPPSVPVVAITDHRHTLRVRRPDVESRACHAADVHQVRAEFVVEFPVLAFGEKMKVELMAGVQERVGMAQAENQPEGE